MHDALTARPWNNERLVLYPDGGVTRLDHACADCQPHDALIVTFATTVLAAGDTAGDGPVGSRPSTGPSSQ